MLTFEMLFCECHCSVKGLTRQSEEIVLFCSVFFTTCCDCLFHIYFCFNWNIAKASVVVCCYVKSKSNQHDKNVFCSYKYRNSLLFYVPTQISCFGWEYVRQNNLTPHCEMNSPIPQGNIRLYIWSTCTNLWKKIDFYLSIAYSHPYIYG